MSYDRAIDFVCPHIVREEALLLENDRATARPQRPIASVQGVKVRLNRVLEVPSVGVYSPATVISARTEPFTMTPTQGTMVIEVNGATYSAYMDPGVKLSAREVVYRLGRSLPSSVLSVIYSKGHVNLVSKNLGPSANIVIRSGGLATALGYALNRVWRGARLAPGFTLVNDPYTLQDRPTKLVVFDIPLKGFGDFIEVDYATVRQECRRCGGLGVENDWRYDISGELVRVQDTALLKQEVQKYMFTLQGSNPAHRWYGTKIVDMLGRKISSSQVVQNLIISEVYEGFRRWQSIKSQQELKAGQYVSDEEYPFRLVSATLEQSDQDPTVIFVDANIQSRSTNPIQIERGIRLPEPLDLLGSTAQEGILRQSSRNATLVG